MESVVTTSDNESVVACIKGCGATAALRVWSRRYRIGAYQLLRLDLARRRSLVVTERVPPALAHYLVHVHHIHFLTHPSPASQHMIYCLFSV